MTAVAPAPLGAEFFLDARGDARSLRVRWHREEGLVVLSLWRGRECTGTFRLAIDEVPILIEALRAGLDAAYDDSRSSSTPRLPSARDEADRAGGQSWRLGAEVSPSGRQFPRAPGETAASIATTR